MPFSIPGIEYAYIVAPRASQGTAVGLFLTSYGTGNLVAWPLQQYMYYTCKKGNEQNSEESNYFNRLRYEGTGILIVIGTILLSITAFVICVKKYGIGATITLFKRRQLAV